METNLDINMGFNRLAADQTLANLDRVIADMAKANKALADHIESPTKRALRIIGYLATCTLIGTAIGFATVSGMLLVLR